MEKINIKLPTTRVTPHTVVYRACGNLEMIYRLNDYSVSNHKDKNKSFKISKHYPWYTTDAMFGDVFGTYAILQAGTFLVVITMMHSMFSRVLILMSGMRFTIFAEIWMRLQKSVRVS